MKRHIVPALLLLAAIFMAMFMKAHPVLIWPLAAVVILLAIAVWDFFQQAHSLRRNYPLIAHIRWFFEDMRPYLRSYIVESNLEGRPFNLDQRSLIYARSKGETSEHPFGTELDVYADEYKWLGHSIVPNAAVASDFRVDVGGPQCKQPYSASIFNISAMSFGALGHRAIEALNLGAKTGGFYHDTGEGSFSEYHARHGGDIVWELGSGYFGCRTENGDFDPVRFRDVAQREQIKMIEIKLSQGAKPGHGGVLPGAKVTREIAETRGVEAYQDCISPVAHSTFSTPVGMMEFVARLRELSGGKPVGIKLCVGQPHEVFAIMKAMLETGIYVDFIVVDGGEGGTGAAPVELSNHVGMPLREGLILMRNALVGTGLRDNIRLAASGKVHSGMGLAMNAALGADWCNAARGFMFSLGCIQAMQCHTGRCPTGITTQDPLRQRALVVEEKAERVALFQKTTVDALRDIVVAMGLDKPGDITLNHLRERINSAKSGSMEHIYSFLEKNALNDDAGKTIYADYWQAAQTVSFRPLMRH